jgi:EAL domain-containing protein (putative c-di-GMP-specific phosphodiesterase class I)
MIVDVGDWVLRRACRDAKAWHDRGFKRVRVAVNLSPRQFLVSDLEQRVQSALADSGLEPWALELELTETAGTLNLDAVVDVLERLAAIGVTTAIDDFGIGHSWLERLRRLPIGTLKIDRSFVAGMAGSASDLAIVEALVALGHALGLHVVAEGVEDEGQLDVVRSIGCDLVQGFFFAPAVPAAQVIHLITGGFSVRRRPLAAAG